MNLVEFLNTPVWGGIKWTRDLEKRLNDSKYLEGFGYKVYSQNDEDGIISEIFKRIGLDNKIFVEFGVDKGIECNSHSLLLQGWKGLWIEGRESAFNQIVRRFAPAIRRGELNVLNKYISIDNISEIISEYLQGRELDLLSIDVDGNDYHIWNAISGEIKPRCVVIEYQGKFPPEIDWIMAYNPDHVWDRSDRSGASLKALEKLGKKKGYQLVGTNICGVNAFFVRDDLCGDKFAQPATAENLYNPVRSNIVKHNNGNHALNYVGQDIEGMEGVFEYYPDWNTLSSFGFWKVEVFPNGRRNTMSEKTAKLFVRWIPQDASMMTIRVSVSIDPNILSEPLEIETIIGDIKTKTIMNKRVQEIKVPLDEFQTSSEIVDVLFVTNCLWNEKILTGNGENRLQGISIDEVSFE